MVCSYLYVYDSCSTAGSGPRLRFCRLPVLIPHHSQVVPAAELALQEEAGATATEPSLGYDSDPVSEDVSLIHEVCGQDDGPAWKNEHYSIKIFPIEI